MKATVLLIDDEDDTRELLGRAVERAGYTCLIAGTAEAAVRLAKAASFVDLVITDIVLANDDRAGLGLMTELRQSGIRAPIIVMTAYADVEKVKIALNEGAAFFLEKPFSVPELLEVIERVHGGGQDPDHAVERALSRAELTDKERKVARYLLEGLSSNEIAALGNNSPKTIRQHVTQIYAKCGVASRAELFRLVYVR